MNKLYIGYLFSPLLCAGIVQAAPMHVGTCTYKVNSYSDSKTLNWCWSTDQEILYTSLMGKSSDFMVMTGGNIGHATISTLYNDIWEITYITQPLPAHWEVSSLSRSGRFVDSNATCKVDINGYGSSTTCSQYMENYKNNSVGG